MPDISIKFLLEKTRSNTYYDPERQHLCYELVYCKDGSGCFSVNGVNVPFKKGMYALFPPSAVISESGSFNKCIYLGFEYNNILGELSCGVFDDVDGRLLNILNTMEVEVQTHSLYSDSCLNSYLMILLYNIARNQEFVNQGKTTYPPQKASLFSDIVTYFEQNYEKRINVTEYFQSIGYSYHHLRHSFKEIYGLSPNQYLTKIRLDAAKKLLLTTDQTIEEISKKCGFNSVSQFVSNFKNDTQNTPIKFREERI